MSALASLMLALLLAVAAAARPLDADPSLVAERPVASVFATLIVKDPNYAPQM